MLGVGPENSPEVALGARAAAPSQIPASTPQAPQIPAALASWALAARPGFDAAGPDFVHFSSLLEPLGVNWASLGDHTAPHNALHRHSPKRGARAGPIRPFIWGHYSGEGEGGPQGDQHRMALGVEKQGHWSAIWGDHSWQGP